MPKKNTRKTPRGQVRSAVKRLWLRSRERSFAIKRDGYTCQACGKKQSKAKGREVKVEVHHLEGVGNWDTAINVIYDCLLCDPDFLQTLCEKCHKNEHGSK